ncbi:MAG: hypothetical protein AAGF67_02145 [Verrucomicrobiota bacterium]
MKASRLLSGFCGLWIMASVTVAQGEDGVVDQREFPDSINGCVPASIVNSLKFSRPEFQAVYGKLVGGEDTVKMRFVTDRYFRLRESTVHQNRKRWGVHGIAADDIVVGLNELLADHELGELSGAYLDRRPGEASLDFAQRIHGTMKQSVDRGVMPILSLRAYYVRQQEELENQPAWEVGPQHAVVITKVGPFEAKSGFLLTALDPWGGKEIAIFLYREGAQSFRALKGVEPTGEWLDGRPFLVASAPEAITLQPGKLEWHERWIVVANYLVGDFD